jgi:hypothetical protein
MSSSTASKMVASLALAALRMRASGRPPRSPARCSLDPCVPRSTGFAPVRSPFDRPQAAGVHADPLQVDAAGLAEFVQQHRLELLEHPGLGPLVKPAPAGGGRAAAQLLGWQRAPGGGGAGHEQQRGHTVAVWHPARDPTAWAGWWRWQEWLDVLPQRLGQESIYQAGHGREHPVPTRIAQATYRPFRNVLLEALQRALELYFASPAVSRTTVDDAVTWFSITCDEANMPDELIETYRAFGPRLAALPPCGECGDLTVGCLGGVASHQVV